MLKNVEKIVFLSANTYFLEAKNMTRFAGKIIRLFVDTNDLYF